MDYYKLLGLSKGATGEEIKKNYRKLAMKYHPDRTKGDKQAEEKFKKISEAYAVLSDKEKRQMYDRYGSADFQQRFSQEDIFRGSDLGSILREFGINFGGGQGASFRTGGMGGFEDIFSSLGGMGGAQQGCRGSCGPGAQRPQKGNDLQLDLFITLEEVLSGTEKTIALGRGVDAEKVSVKVPPGIESGKKLRVSGKGSPSPAGGAPGDLYLLIRVNSHPVFIREGKDLIVDRKIRLSEALLGCEINVPTMGGKELKVKIPAGTQPNSKLRIKGKGLPDGPKASRGNMFVRIVLDLPKKLTKEQKQLVEDLASQGL